MSTTGGRPRTVEQMIVDHLTRSGVQRTGDLEPLGVSRQYLSRLVQKGVIHRVGRGLYALPTARGSDSYAVVHASRRVPHGVICLLSALHLHNMASHAPPEVWLAIDRKARLPAADCAALRIVRFSGKPLTAGIQRFRVEGVYIRVYVPAKTVADCFKYRNKIGLKVAIAALRACREQTKATADELWKYANICRVTTVMRPYLESIP